MGFLRLDKRTKHQQFKYIPRFYDPAKEDLKNRMGLHDKDNPNLDQTELAKQRIRLGLKSRSRVDPAYRKKETKGYNTRLFTIVGVLIFLTYFVLTSDKILSLLTQILE